MRILIFNWRDIKNPTSGGAEIATHEIAKRLVKRGYSVTLFTSKFNSCKESEILDGVKILRKGSAFTVYFWAVIYYFKHFKGEIDLVIDQIHGLPFFTPLYVKEPKIAYIHEVAGEIWFWEWMFPVSVLGYILEKLYFKIYKKITFITASESTKQDLIIYGIDESKIKIIKNGLTSPSFKLSELVKEKIPTIIYLGRIYESKRVDHIIKSFKIVQQKYPNSRLWIVGVGKNYYLSLLKKLVQRFKLSKKVKFYGFVNEEKKFELLAKAWVICATSVKEGWGLSIIEAASVSTPAIVYNVGGLKDAVIDNQTGLICKVNTSDNLARNILKLTSNSNLRKIFAENAALHTKKFSWDQTAFKFEQVLYRALKAS